MRERWRQRFQFGGEIVGQIRLGQKLCVLRREIRFHRSGGNLQSAQPPAETDQMRHFLIAQFNHRLLDIGLGRDQFLPDLLPLTAPAELGQARAVPYHSIAHAERSRLFHQHTPKIFDQILSLRFNDQKTIGDQFAKNHSFLLTAGGDRLRMLALQLIEREWPQLIELREDLFDGWRGVGIDAKLLPFVPFVFVRLFLVRANRDRRQRRRNEDRDRANFSALWCRFAEAIGPFLI